VEETVRVAAGYLWGVPAHRRHRGCAQGARDRLDRGHRAAPADAHRRGGGRRRRPPA